MSFLKGFFGGGSETTVASGAAKGLSEEEKTLINKQIELTDFVLSQLTTQGEFQGGLFDSLNQKIINTTQFQGIRDRLEKAQLLQAERLLPLQEEIAKIELEAIKRGGRVDPETAAFIDELFGKQREIGISDIDVDTQRVLEQITQEISPGAGLRPTDTPTLNRLEGVGEESIRQRGQLTRGLSAKAAQAKLNFPLAQGQLTSARGQFLANLSSSAGQFQSKLEQQAFLNRILLINQTGGLGLGLATGVGVNPGALGADLLNSRINAGDTTTSTNEDANIADIIAGAGAVAGLFSHSSLKENIHEINTQKILKQIINLPIYTWHYTGDKIKHIGPMAEEFKNAFGVGDGYTLNLIDVMGVMLSAVKGMAEVNDHG